MITRPLELASKMRSEPRSFDWLFFVNGGLIVLFFSLFGSRFVLAPGLGVDFRLPEVPGAVEKARATTHMISVTNSGVIFTTAGREDIDKLADWLKRERRGEPAPVLLVRVDRGVSMAMLTDIARAAEAAGFAVQLAVDEPLPTKKNSEP